MKKLAVISTHPIQYNAPFFKQLGDVIDTKVFYTIPQFVRSFFDPDFKRKIEWDIPLLEGYDYELVENISSRPSSKSWYGVDCPGLIDRVKEFSPDAVLVYGWNLKSHFTVMRYYKGKIPVWFRGDSHDLDRISFLKKTVRRVILYFVYRFTDKIFYTGQANRQYFLNAGLKKDQLIYAPHAVDNERLKDNGNKFKDKAKVWRKELGFNQHDIVVLFAGKFEPKKAPILLLEAIISAHQKRSEIKALFVGSGELEELMKSKTKKLDCVKFLPMQNQSLMPVIYRIADVFCLPSKGPGETWGLSVNEAMACSIPVILSNAVGCHHDLIDNLETGYIFKNGMAKELSRILENLNKSELSIMGKKARVKVSSFDYAFFIGAILKEFEK